MLLLHDRCSALIALAKLLRAGCRWPAKLLSGRRSTWCSRSSFCVAGAGAVLGPLWRICYVLRRELFRQAQYLIGRRSGEYLTRAWSPWVPARFCVAGAALRAPRAAVGCCALGRLGPRRVSAWQVRSGCFKPHIFVLFFSMFGSVQLTLFKRLPFFPTSLCGFFVFTCVSRRSSPFHVIRIQAKINSNSHTPTCAIQFTQLDSHHPTHTTQLNSHNRCLELLRARWPVGRKHFGLQSLFPVEYLVPPQLLLCGRCSALTALVPRAFCVAGAMASSWCLCSCFCMTGAAPSALSMELLFCVENLLRAWLPCIPERFSVAGAALCAPLAR